MQLSVLSNDFKKQDSAKLDVDAGVFSAEMKADLVHQVVTAYRAGGRAGTKSTKSRSEVSGGGKKPWRQKGTGRARAGSIRSPIWVGGGMTFAAQPRSFAQKVNRKMYRAAMRSILSELHRRDAIVVVESMELAEPKTKLLLEKLSNFSGKRTLIVTEELDENLYLASRNLIDVAVMDADVINPLALFWPDQIVLTKAAILRLQERLK